MKMTTSVMSLIGMTIFGTVHIVTMGSLTVRMTTEGMSTVGMPAACISLGGISTVGMTSPRLATVGKSLRPSGLKSTNFLNVRCERNKSRFVFVAELNTEC